MFIRPVFIGFVAAIIVELSRVLRNLVPQSYKTPYLIFPIILFVLFYQIFLRRSEGHSKKNYFGLSDLFVYIHSPAKPDSTVHWIFRGITSFLFCVFGFSVGPEGAITELTHALTSSQRSRSSRWFEQLRRTDAATVLSAAISAVFEAPFAALLVSIELGIGGRILSPVTSSLSAFVFSRVIDRVFQIERLNLATDLYPFNFAQPSYWICIFVVAILCSVMSLLFVFFKKYFHENTVELIGKRTWLTILIGGGCLFFIYMLYKDAQMSPKDLIEQVFLVRSSLQEVALLFFILFLTLAILVSTFGTIGIFWPLFVLGGLIGYGVDHYFQMSFSGFSGGFTGIAILAGGVAFWGGTLGIPLSGAVLSYELSHHIHVLIPCLLAGFTAKKLSQILKSHPIVYKELQAYGISLVGGRSATVLELVSVRDAMVTDFETVYEQEPISDLYFKLLKSRYPFLPVVDQKGKYVGILTVDMVEESWQTEDPKTSHTSLSQLLEAKDILYRSGFKTPTLRTNDKLSKTTGVFEEIPCVPVLEVDGKVAGLLFAYNVRFAYEREETRRSLEMRIKKSEDFC